MRNIAMLIGLFAMLFFNACGGGGGSKGDSSATDKSLTILFPNQTSSVFFVDYLPDGTGIVAHKGASGEISNLDIVEADGTYYQLLFGNTGLPKIKIGGYEIEVVSADVNNKVIQAAVKNPGGVVLEYKSLAVLENNNSIQPTSIVNSACNNPDGTQGLEDEDFAKTYACHISLEFGHVTFDLVRGVSNLLMTTKENVDKVLRYAAGEVFRTATKVEESLDELAVKLNNSQDLNESADNIYVYPDVVEQSDSGESFSRILIGEVEKLAESQYDLNSSGIDPLLLQTLDGEQITIDDGAEDNESLITDATTAVEIPVISTITPTSGAAGTIVSIAGANFDTNIANNTVKFNGTEATVSTATATLLTVEVPNGASSGQISVGTAGGTATANESFTVASGSEMEVGEGCGSDPDLFLYNGECVYGFCLTQALGCSPLDWMWGSKKGAEDYCDIVSFGSGLKQTDNCQ